MKMLKKAVAILLVAAMSLVMLTACGGGSGSTTQYKLAKIVSESQKTGQMNMDVTAPVGYNNATMRVRVAVKDGKQVMFLGSEDGEGYYFLNVNDTAYYLDDHVEDEKDLTWKKASSSEASTVGQVSSVVPSQSSLSSIKVNPEYEVKDKGTYYAEIVTAEGQETAYCFKDDAVKYMVITYNNQSVVADVKDFSAKLPEDMAFLFNVPIAD